MPPFTAPDGTSFESKSEYRKYMFNKYYTFKEQQGAHLTKAAGEIDGFVVASRSRPRVALAAAAPPHLCYCGVANLSTSRV